MTNAALAGDQVGFRSYSGRGTTAGNPGFTIGSVATADAQNQDAIGVEGDAYSNNATKAGGYFESFSYPGVSVAYAWVDAQPDPPDIAKTKLLLGRLTNRISQPRAIAAIEVVISLGWRPVDLDDDEGSE